MLDFVEDSLADGSRGSRHVQPALAENSSATIDKVLLHKLAQLLEYARGERDIIADGAYAVRCRRDLGSQCVEFDGDLAAYSAEAQERGCNAYPIQGEILLYRTLSERNDAQDSQLGGPSSDADKLAAQSVYIWIPGLQISRF